LLADTQSVASSNQPKYLHC